MKIRNVSCRQFAGVRNQNVVFTDGINVVFGQNESGKSTLVNLLSRTLFQDAKLSKNKKPDKEFVEQYLLSCLEFSAVLLFSITEYSAHLERSLLSLFPLEGL